MSTMTPTYTTPDKLPSYDVVVVGSGIAGCVAAITAAQAGARVALCCAGKLFGGSSFFEGTWGLGLIAPENHADEQDLCQTIAQVGEGAIDKDLVHCFVHNIAPALSWLQNSCHVTLRRASNTKKQQRDYLPCFDHKHRAWYGLEHDALKTGFEQQFLALGIDCYPQRCLVDIQTCGNDAEDDGTSGNGATSDEKVCGVELYDLLGKCFVHLACSSMVLATGGFGGLFSPTLTQPDVLSVAHSIALSHGASLVNAEFMQFMPCIVRPVRGVIFNEKTFKYARLNADINEMQSRSETQVESEAKNNDDWHNPLHDKRLLDQRSEHGPFSARLDDAAIDLAIDKSVTRTAQVQYELPAQLPEFMQTYFSWLQTTAQIKPGDPLEIALWPHASNGGLLIDTQTNCIGGPSGLYAAGECCGGMHGADRLGGLSSANGLVFGRIAGSAAAAHALGTDHTHITMQTQGAVCRQAQRFSGQVLPQRTLVTQYLQQIRACMQRYAGIRRCAEGLQQAKTLLEKLRMQMGASLVPASLVPVGQCVVDQASPKQNSDQNVNELRYGTILCYNLLQEALLVLHAMNWRAESRGSHYRSDAPHKLPRFEGMQKVSLDPHDHTIVYSELLDTL